MRNQNKTYCHRKFHSLQILIYAILIATSACRSGSTGENDIEQLNSVQDEIILSDRQVELAGIRLGKLEKKTLFEEIRCNGSLVVRPEALRTITLPMDSYVKEIHVYAGAQVVKGDLLIVMAHPDFIELQEKFLVAGNSLQMLKEDLERQKILAGENAASGKKLTEARTDYENRLVEYSSLREQLAMLGFDPGSLDAGNLGSELRLYAPATGFIRENFANSGELMHAGDPILELEENKSLLAHLIIYQKDIGRVKPGQEVIFTAGTGTKEYHAKIHIVGRSVSEDTRSVEVHADILNPDEYLLSGMYTKAKILAESQDVYTLPETGIAREGELAYLFLTDGNRFRRVPVTTGIMNGGFVEIRTPESLIGKELALTGAYYLNAGYTED